MSLYLSVIVFLIPVCLFQYRAPSFKSKRSITKEKYSPKLKNGEPRTVSSCKGKDDESKEKEKENKMTSSYENEMKMKTATCVFGRHLTNLSPRTFYLVQLKSVYSILIGLKRTLFFSFTSFDISFIFFNIPTYT